MDTFDDIQSLTERISANKPKIDMKRRETTPHALISACILIIHRRTCTILAGIHNCGVLSSCRLNAGLEQVKQLAMQETKRREQERKKAEQRQRAADAMKARQMLIEQQDDDSEAARQRDMASAGDAAMNAMGGGVDGEPEPAIYEPVLQPTPVSNQCRCQVTRAS